MLTSILHPMSLDTFFTRHWERAMTLQSHQLAGHSTGSGGNEGWFRGEASHQCWTQATAEKPLASSDEPLERSIPVTDGKTVCASVQSALDLEMEMIDLTLLLDSGGSVFEPLRADGAVTRFSSSDLRLVKRVLAADGEWWTAAVPLDSVPAAQAIDSRFVRAGLSRGFTLVLNRVNYRHAAIARLCTALQRDVFGYRVQANLYVTPANSSGFEAHFDWQQSVVLQLHGAKRWTLMDPPLVQLPRSDMKFKPTRAAMAALRRDHRLLETGSALYFPAGMIHEATTAAAEVEGNASGRAELGAEAADLARQHPDSALSGTPSSTHPLPLSMHLTLGVEIDPAFTMQGLLHVFLDRMQNEPAWAEELLLAPAWALLGSRCSMLQPSEPPSVVRVLDLLQLVVLSEASSRVNPRAHEFRRSLLGLHSWSDRDGSLFAVSRPTTRDELSCAHLWSHYNATQLQTQCFAWRIEGQLYELMRPLETLKPAALQRAAAYAEQHQQRIRHAADARAGTAASSPSPQAYEFESLFADALLSPLVQPALESRWFVAWLSALFVGPFTPCADAMANSLGQLLGRMLLLFDRPCPLDTHEFPVPYDPLPLHCLLRSSLLSLQDHLGRINTQQRQAQQAHLRSNLNRARHAQQQVARQFSQRKQADALR